MVPTPNTLWRNLKKGTWYEVTSVAKDCTNARDGSRVVVYRSIEEDLTFVRDEAEFVAKFEPAEPAPGPLAGRTFGGLELRAMGSDQAEAFFAHVEENRGDYTDPIPFVSQVRDPAAMRARIQANLVRQARGLGEFYTLWDGTTMAGYFLIREKDRDAGWAEVGYMLGRPWRGRGLATEVTRALVDEVFRQGFTKVVLCCNDDNQASRALADRLGFVLEGVLADHMVVAGRRRNLACYGLRRPAHQA